MSFSLLIVSILAPLMVSADSGTGTTTRYWDCCKPSCAWNNLQQLGIQSSVTSCDVNDQPLSTNTDQSGCIGGGAFMCSSQSPWAVSDDLAYGFTAVSSANPACCQCYQLTFTSGPATGKTMIVQATNTGTDVSSTQFDLAMPGGGFGIFNGCSAEWQATSSVWGQQYGGMSANQCSQMPNALQAGCNFRWGSFFAGSDNPTVNWETVTCPLELTQKSGCVRVGDNPTPGAGSPAASSTAAASSSSSSAPTTISTIIIPTSFSSILSAIPSSIPVASSSAIPSSIPSSSSSAVPSSVSSSSSSVPIIIQPTTTQSKTKGRHHHHSHSSTLSTISTLLTVHVPSTASSAAAATTATSIQPGPSDGPGDSGCDL